MAQQFDHAGQADEREFSAAARSPSGQSVVLGSYGRLRVFNFQVRRGSWEEAPAKEVESLYGVAKLEWKPDGSRLTLGSLCGAVEEYDCCLRRNVHRGKFEFTYVGPSHVIVKRLSTGKRIGLKSYSDEIQKVRRRACWAAARAAKAQLKHNAALRSMC